MKIQIITYNNQNIKTISGFSKRKAEHITKTNQWGYVISQILKTK